MSASRTGDDGAAPDPRYAYDHEAFLARLATDPESGGYPPDLAEWPQDPRVKWIADNTAARLADSDPFVGARNGEYGQPIPFEEFMKLSADERPA